MSGADAYISPCTYLRPSRHMLNVPAGPAGPEGPWRDAKVSKSTWYVLPISGTGYERMLLGLVLAPLG